MKKFLAIIIALFFILLHSSLFSSAAFANSVYFTSSPSFYVNAGSEYTYQITAKSTANLALTFSFQNLPGWLSFNTSNHILSGSTQDAGKYTIYITVRDTQGNTDIQNYFLYVVAQTTPTPSPTAMQTPSPTPVMTTIMPTQTPTPAATKTATPTPTKVQVSTTVPILTLTPTVVPTPIGANTINIANQTPANKSTISSTTPTISATITSGFAIDKTNLQIFFDNLDVTQKATVTTTHNVNYQTTFTYTPANISQGQIHNVNIIITNPDGIPITEGWSFSANGSNNTLTKSVKGFFSSQVTGILLTIIGLLLFIIIVVKLITRRTQLKEEEKKSS